MISLQLFSFTINRYFYYWTWGMIKHHVVWLDTFILYIFNLLILVYFFVSIASDSETQTKPTSRSSHYYYVVHFVSKTLCTYLQMYAPHLHYCSSMKTNSAILDHFTIFSWEYQETLKRDYTCFQGKCLIAANARVTAGFICAPET